MMNRYFRLLLALCVVFASVSVSIAGQVVKYKLEANEYLYANGVAFDELVVSENDNGDEIYINGVLVYKYYKPRPVVRPLMWPKRLGDSKQVKNLIEQGLSEPEALETYKFKISEFAELIEASLNNIVSGEITVREARGFLRAWMEQPSHVGLVDSVKMTSNSSSWRQAAGGQPVGEMVAVGMKELVAPTDLRTFAEGYITSFRRSRSSQMLLVSSRGVRSIQGEQHIRDINLQISEVRKTATYSTEPLSLADLRKFGFVAEVGE